MSHFDNFWCLRLEENVTEWVNTEVKPERGEIFLGIHPTPKPHLKYLAVFVKPLRSFTYRCVKNALKRKRSGHFFLAVAVVCGFRRCVRFSWGWGFKIFQDLCPLVIRKNSFNVPGHLSEYL